MLLSGMEANLLRKLSEGATPLSEITSRRQDLVDDFVAKGWAEINGGVVNLTPAGEALLRSLSG